MNPFGVGREMTKPHTSGKFFGSLSFEEIRKLTTDLTPNEEASEFSKYYYEPMGEIQPEHQAAIDGAPMDPADCYMPCDVAAHINNTGHDKIENGYGVMENGVGFAAIKINQDDITDEMIAYYRENFAQVDDLFYKTWFPKAHLLHYVDGAIEDFGWAMLNMNMTFTADLSTLGFGSEEEILKNDPKCIGSMVASGLSTPVEDPESGEEIMSMFSYTRDTGNGRELRVRYWVGLAFDSEGKQMIRIKEDKTPVLEKAKMMMEHCMREYSNEKRLIKAFWAARK